MMRPAPSQAQLSLAASHFLADQKFVSLIVNKYSEKDSEKDTDEMEC